MSLPCYCKITVQEGIDPGRIANNGGKCLDASRQVLTSSSFCHWNRHHHLPHHGQVILPSVRGSQRLLGEKLKPVVLTPRSVAAPQVIIIIGIVVFITKINPHFDYCISSYLPPNNKYFAASSQFHLTSRQLVHLLPFSPTD